MAINLYYVETIWGAIVLYGLLQSDLYSKYQRRLKRDKQFEKRANLTLSWI